MLILSSKALKENVFFEIGVDGYGDYDSMDGCGAPIALEMRDGKLRLHVFADINSGAPTHTIDLEGARESARKEEPDA